MMINQMRHTTKETEKQLEVLLMNKKLSECKNNEKKSEHKKSQKSEGEQKLMQRNKREETSIETVQFFE